MISLLTNNLERANFHGRNQAPSGHWGVSSFQLILNAKGTARFAIRISTPETWKAADVLIQTRSIGAAVVGVDFERLFASPSLLPQPPPPSLPDELRQLVELLSEGVLNKDEFASAKAKCLARHNFM